MQGWPAFFCPACKILHICKDKKFNGNVDRPTFKVRIDRPGCEVDVHFGIMKFSDKSKTLAGQSVVLPELPWWVK